MIDCAIGNLQSQNKDLKRQITFHENKKDDKNDFNLKKVEKEKTPKPKPKPVTTESAETGEIHKKFEVKVQKIEENICQWIDDETKTIKETIEKDITSIRSEVD